MKEHWSIANIEFYLACLFFWGCFFTHFGSQQLRTQNGGLQCKTAAVVPNLVTYVTAVTRPTRTGPVGPLSVSQGSIGRVVFRQPRPRALFPFFGALLFSQVKSQRKTLQIAQRRNKTIEVAPTLFCSKKKVNKHVKETEIK